MAMNGLLHIAEIGMDGIIWLILALLWGVAQIVGVGKKRRILPTPPVAPESTPASSPSEGERQLREIFEQLTGLPATLEAPPPPVPAPPAHKPSKAMRVKKARHTPPPPPPLHRYPIADPPVEIDHYAQVSDHDMATRKGYKTTQSNLLPRLSAMALKSSSWPALGMTGSLRQRRTGRCAPPNLKGRDAVRQALLSRIVLGAPRGLEGMTNDTALRLSE